MRPDEIAGALKAAAEDRRTTILEAAKIAERHGDEYSALTVEGRMARAACETIHFRLLAMLD